jgi:hypothetical protein
MNSIQLISKINSRIEDLAMLSQEILKPNSDLSNIEKEVLKRNCSDLFELVLKLKTSNDLSEEQLALKENLSQEIRNNEFNFKEVITNSFQEDLSINSIAEIKLQEPIIAEEPIENIFEPIIEIELKNIKPIGSILAEIAEDYNPLIVEETELFSIESEVIETIIEEPMIEVEPMVADEPMVININDEIVEIPIADTNFEEPIIIQKVIEIPVFETKLVNESQKEKPVSFFSIGKTVMPKTEPSLNEKIAQNLDGFQLSEKVIEPKIDNLKTAISLNKKIAFVNELFKENVVEYAKSIDKINSSNNLNEAMLIWSELKINHNWSNENNLVKDLEKLIERRFS